MWRVYVKRRMQKCKEQTVLVHPAKFSPDDKYARLRIAEKPN